MTKVQRCFQPAEAVSAARYSHRCNKSTSSCVFLLMLLLFYFCLSVSSIQWPLNTETRKELRDWTRMSGKWENTEASHKQLDCSSECSELNVLLFSFNTFTYDNEQTYFDIKCKTFASLINLIFLFLNILWAFANYAEDGRRRDLSID